MSFKRAKEAVINCGLSELKISGIWAPALMVEEDDDNRRNDLDDPVNGVLVEGMLKFSSTDTISCKSGDFLAGLRQR